MCGEGFIEGARTIKAYVKPYNAPWKEVQAVDSDGLAIFEGCIILGKTSAVTNSHADLAQQVAAMPKLLTEASVETRGAGIVGAQYRWKNRTIPYTIGADVPDPQRVMAAIAHWHAKSSIRFVPRTAEKDYLAIVRDNRGCASMVGRQGGEQQLILGDFCTTGNIIHELGHTIGLWHEQCRIDRDDFIAIDLDNVKPEAAHNFEQKLVETIDIGPYDFGSIMHYPPTAFAAAPGDITIRPKTPLPPGVTMGQREALSTGDIAAVEALYQGVPAATAHG